jgi:hypothetical protein
MFSTTGLYGQARSVGRLFGNITKYKENAMSRTIRKTIMAGTLGIAALAAAGGSAAQVTMDGVTFSSSWSGNVLTIEIDALARTGGWASATTIGALQVKNVGTFDSVTMTGPGAASGWSIVANELEAGGCGGGLHAGMNACASGTWVPLDDNMVFVYTFTGAGLDLTNPHLKVNFFGTGPDKVGSLLSMNVPAVPEPSSYAMLLLGVGLLGFMGRRSRGG